MVSGVNNEALAGDLLEQFGQGRSAGWYWRQVIAAIVVGVYKEQRIFWIAVGIAPVWMRFSSHFGSELNSFICSEVSWAEDFRGLGR